MKFYDNHTHTMYSHDSEASPMEMCESAIKKGLSAITFTEHCDTDFMFEEHDVFASIGRSIDKAKELNSRYDGILNIYSGFEISENFWNPTNYRRVMDAYYDKIDALLCSVHLTRYPGLENIPNSAHSYDTFSDGMINAIIECYYDDMAEMLSFTECGSILCHLTYPFRYITLKYGKNSFRYNDYIKRIRDILITTVKKDMALEVNTSNIEKFKDAFFMPDYDIICLYRSLGGKLVSLGSDAHTPYDVGKAFDKAIATIKKAGFNEYCYFKCKNPVSVNI